MLIPIVPTVDLFSVVFLIILNIHFWIRTKGKKIRSVRTFAWFLFAFLLLMFTLSLPAFFANKLFVVQLLLDISTLFFYIAFALFLRFILLFIGAEKRLFSFIPFILVFCGILLFAWQISKITPVEIITLKTINNVNFIIYTDNAPYLTRIITGMVGFLIFGTGSILFFIRGNKVENSTLRRRSFLIGYGCLAGLFTNLFNSVFYIWPDLIFSFFLASIGALASVVLVYAGVLVDTKGSCGSRLDG